MWIAGGYSEKSLDQFFGERKKESKGLKREAKKILLSNWGEEGEGEQPFATGSAWESSRRKGGRSFIPLAEEKRQGVK